MRGWSISGPNCLANSNFFITSFLGNKADILIFCVLAPVIISQVALNFGGGSKEMLLFVNYYY